MFQQALRTTEKKEKKKVHFGNQNNATRSTALPVVLEPLPQPRPANRGAPPDQGEGDGRF